MTETPTPQNPDTASSADLARMVRVWLLLVAAMGVVGLACWAAMPRGPGGRAGRTAIGNQPNPSPLEALVWPDGLTADRHWRFIVIHHSATQSATLEAIRRWHRGDAGYHFLINNGKATGTRDGQITPTRRWIEQRAGAHCQVRGHPQFNTQGIGICLVGHLNLDPPTRAQMDSLEALVASLCARYRIPLEHIVAHGELKNTQCPGKLFPMETFLWELRKTYINRYAQRPPAGRG